VKWTSVTPSTLDKLMVMGRSLLKIVSGKILAHILLGTTNKN
jgi:hypothetical protein